MQLFSLSLEDIENDLISYFSNRFGDDPSTFTSATDVEATYNFSANAWAQMGDTLSGLPWMQHLGVVLGPKDMGRVSTIGQIASLISSKIKHVVAPADATSVVPMAPLMRMSRSSSAQPRVTPRRPRSHSKKKKKTR